MKFFVCFRPAYKKYFIFLLLSFSGFLPNKVSAQLQTRITFVYQELQINTSAAQLKDTIQLYVKEPFKPRKLYQNADLGYESFIEFQIDEFCPVEVCKNNECFEIFADSENVEILVNPENFIGSRTLNSPLSDTWRLIGLERGRFRDVNTDLFGSDKDPATRNRSIDENYRLYSETMNQFFRDNNRNHIGWTCFCSGTRNIRRMEFRK
jgi:hypothetical protein